MDKCTKDLTAPLARSLSGRVISREEREDLPIGAKSTFSLGMGFGTNITQCTEGALREQYKNCERFSDEQVDEIIFIVKTGLGMFHFGSPSHVIAGHMRRLYAAFGLPGDLHLQIDYTTLVLNAHGGPTHILHHTQGYGLNKVNDIQFMVACVLDAKKNGKPVDSLTILQAMDGLINREPDFTHKEWQTAFYIFPMALTIAVFNGSWYTLATTAAIQACRLLFTFMIHGLGQCMPSFKALYEDFEKRIAPLHVTVILPFFTGALTALIGEKIFEMDLCLLPGVYLAIILFFLPGVELIYGGSEMINGYSVGVTRLFMAIHETMYMGCSLFLGWTCVTSSPMPTHWPCPGGLPWYLGENGLFSVALLVCSMILFGVQKKIKFIVVGALGIKFTLLAGEYLGEILPSGAMQNEFFQQPLSMAIACAIASTVDLLFGQSYQAVLIPIMVIRAPNIPALLAVMTGVEGMHELVTSKNMAEAQIQLLLATSFCLFTLLMNAASYSIGIQTSMVFWQPVLAAKSRARASVAGLTWTASAEKSYF